MGVGPVRVDTRTWVVSLRIRYVCLPNTDSLERRVYTQNLWSFLDVTFAAIYWIYLFIRIYGWQVNSVWAGQQALDVLAMGAPVLIPRLAFNLLSDNMLFLSLRSMMSDFALLTALAGWCFFGFLLSLLWLGNGEFPAFTISKWMIYIWFGLDGSGIHYSVCVPHPLRHHR